MAEGDGYSGEYLFQNVRSCQAYTFDDVILLPGLLRLYLVSDNLQDILKMKSWIFHWSLLSVVELN